MENEIANLTQEVRHHDVLIFIGCILKMIFFFYIMRSFFKQTNKFKILFDNSLLYILKTPISYKTPLIFNCCYPLLRKINKKF